MTTEPLKLQGPFCKKVEGGSIKHFLVNNFLKRQNPHNHWRELSCFIVVWLCESTIALKPVALISGSNWNLEWWFLRREENRRSWKKKALGAGTRTNNKFNPHMAPGRNRTQARLVRGERSHHWVFSAPSLSFYCFVSLKLDFNTKQ